MFKRRQVSTIEAMAPIFGPASGLPMCSQFFCYGEIFIGEADAGQRSAIVYTIIESCRRRGIDPYAYLLDVLTRLPGMTNHQIAEITCRWQKCHHARPVWRDKGRAGDPTADGCCSR